MVNVELVYQLLCFFYQKFAYTYIQAGVNVMLKCKAMLLCHILRENF